MAYDNIQFIGFAIDTAPARQRGGAEAYLDWAILNRISKRAVR